MRTDSKQPGSTEPGWVFFRQRLDFGLEELVGNIDSLKAVQTPSNPELFWKLIAPSDLAAYKKYLAAFHGAPEHGPRLLRLIFPATQRPVSVLEFRMSSADTEGRLHGYEGLWLEAERFPQHNLTPTGEAATLTYLTGGLAHYLNNVLFGLYSLSETFLLQAGKDNPFLDGLALMKQKAEEASQTLHGFTRFLNEKGCGRSLRDLNQTARETFDLVRGLLPNRISVELRCSPAALPIDADGARIKHAFLDVLAHLAQVTQGTVAFIIETAEHIDFGAFDGWTNEPPTAPAVSLGLRVKGCLAPRSGCAEPIQIAADPSSPLFPARRIAEEHGGAVRSIDTQQPGILLELWLPKANIS